MMGSLLQPTQTFSFLKNMYLKQLLQQDTDPMPK